MADKPGDPAVNQQVDVAPQQAMLDYLDELLQGATELQLPEQAPPLPVETPAPSSPPQPAEQAVLEPASSALPEPLPDWARGEFEVLLFDVQGLLLAVPIIELGGILRTPDRLEQLPRQPDWMLGILEAEGRTLSVVDTLRWIAPERVGLAESQPARYLVRLPDSPWALSCQKLFEAVTLQSSDVQWRSARTRRRWLRGTVRDRMCALLDVHELAVLLDRDAGRNGPEK